MYHYYVLAAGKWDKKKKKKKEISQAEPARLRLSLEREIYIYRKRGWLREGLARVTTLGEGKSSSGIKRRARSIRREHKPRGSWKILALNCASGGRKRLLLLLLRLETRHFWCRKILDSLFELYTFNRYYLANEIKTIMVNRLIQIPSMEKFFLSAVKISISI